MTEVLLQQLEEKMMFKLGEWEKQSREFEAAKRELDTAKRENAILKVEREKLEDRIKNIIALLETVNMPEPAQANNAMNKPVLVQA